MYLPNHEAGQRSQVASGWGLYWGIQGTSHHCQILFSTRLDKRSFPWVCSKACYLWFLTATLSCAEHVFYGNLRCPQRFQGDFCRSAYTSFNCLLIAHLLCAFLQVSLSEHPFLSHHPGNVARFLEDMSVKSGGHRHGGGRTGAADGTYLPSDKLKNFLDCGSSPGSATVNIWDRFYVLPVVLKLASKSKISFLCTCCN